MTIPVNEWVWYGFPGHFIAAKECQFRLCTEVGPHIISTVGDLYINDKRSTVGSGKSDWFETMVFRHGNDRCVLKDCRCNMPEIIPSELECYRSKNAGEAYMIHMKMCRQYARPKFYARKMGDV